MKKSGPPPLPTKLKLLRGTFREHRGVANEPMPPPEVPPIPEHLSPEAKAEWIRVSVDLHALGLLSKIDRAILALYCENWADWVDASRMCATRESQDRKVIKTGAGNLVENPYYSIKKRAAELTHKFAVELGMTPAARTRINATPVEDENATGSWANFGS